MIIVRLQGGLGNQLFQYAFGRSLAHQLGTGFLMDCRFLLDRTPKPNFVFRDYDLSIFEIEEKFYKNNESLLPFEVYIDKLYNGLIKKAKRILPSSFSNIYIEPRPFYFDEKYISIMSDAYCLGYFQSYKYFEPIKDIIKAELSFKNPISSNCLEVLHQINSCNSVCLHIRRGDYVNNNYHGTIDIDYYIKALALLSTLENEIEIFVFSDDIEWCKQHLKFKYVTNFVAEIYAGQKARNHFELMMSCKHFIISNSSFAWWAAYLAKNATKKVFAPKQWVTNETINTLDLFPENWVLL